MYKRQTLNISRESSRSPVSLSGMYGNPNAMMVPIPHPYQSSQTSTLNQVSTAERSPAVTPPTSPSKNKPARKKAPKQPKAKIDPESPTSALAPVSYTHLDVYKRQISGSANILQIT